MMRLVIVVIVAVACVEALPRLSNDLASLEAILENQARRDSAPECDERCKAVGRTIMQKLGALCMDAHKMSTAAGMIEQAKRDAGDDGAVKELIEDIFENFKEACVGLHTLYVSTTGGAAPTKRQNEECDANCMRVGGAILKKLGGVCTEAHTMATAAGLLESAKRDVGSSEEDDLKEIVEDVFDNFKDACEGLYYLSQIAPQPQPPAKRDEDCDENCKRVGMRVMENLGGVCMDAQKMATAAGMMEQAKRDAGDNEAVKKIIEEIWASFGAACEGLGDFWKAVSGGAMPAPARRQMGSCDEACIRVGKAIMSKLGAVCMDANNRAKAAGLIQKAKRDAGSGEDEIKEIVEDIFDNFRVICEGLHELSQIAPQPPAKRDEDKPECDEDCKKVGMEIMQKIGGVCMDAHKMAKAASMIEQAKRDAGDDQAVKELIEGIFDSFKAACEGLGDFWTAVQAKVNPAEAGQDAMSSPARRGDEECDENCMKVGKTIMMKLGGVCMEAHALSTAAGLIQQAKRDSDDENDVHELIKGIFEHFKAACEGLHNLYLVKNGATAPARRDTAADGSPECDAKCIEVGSKIMERLGAVCLDAGARASAAGLIRQLRGDSTDVESIIKDIFDNFHAACQGLGTLYMSMQP